MINKSFITNLIAFMIIVVSYVFPQPILLSIGLFAFSGAVTNWLAVHMLFEKVPGFYGSGIIPARFEEFKIAIKHLMMEQFFNQDNIDKFLSSPQGVMPDLHLEPVIEKVDLSPAFERLVDVIMESSFGGMLGMFGGKEAILPLKEPFIKSMKKSLVDLSHQPDFIESLKYEIEQPETMTDIQAKVAEIVDKRLAELTPQLVKEIVQTMIKQHLGWLVVWGGVLGGIIGLLSATIIR